MNWTHTNEPTGSVVPKCRQMINEEAKKNCQQVYQIAVNLMEGVLSQWPLHRRRRLCHPLSGGVSVVISLL